MFCKDEIYRFFWEIAGMKIALCLSGHLRSFEKTFESIKEHLLDPFQPDVFISSWNERGYWTRNDTLGVNDFSKITETEWDLVKSLYNPKTIEHEDLFEWKKLEFQQRAEKILQTGQNKLRWGRPQNIIGAFYKLCKADELRTNYESQYNFKYDFVIRARPDLLIRKCPFEFLKGDKNRVQVFRDCSGLLQDALFATSGENMSHICSLHHQLEIFCLKNKCLFDFHDILEHRLDNLELSKYCLPIDYTLVNTPQGYCCA
jgi:hypothetical protein